MTCITEVKLLEGSQATKIYHHFKCAWSFFHFPLKSMRKKLELKNGC